MVRQRTEVNDRISQFLTRSFTRAAARSTLAASAPVVGVSGTVGSAGNLAALSKAIAFVAGQADKILKDIEDLNDSTPTIPNPWITLREWKDIQIIDFLTGLLFVHCMADPVNLCETRDKLIGVPQALRQNGNECRLLLRYVPASWKGTTKTMTVETRYLDEANILVVGIRGSVSLMDWAVNANSEPADASELGESSVCHRGYLDVARRMEGTVTQIVHESLPSRNSSATLLFTGHSAGAAIAQLLFGFSHSGTTKLSRVASAYQQIDCITFGGPPIAVPPISCPAKSLFLSFANEGDPVPLAQTEYVNSLLTVYAVPPPAQMADLPLPDPFYGFSGTCIVLRDMAFEDHDIVDIQAFTIDPAALTRVIFGNIPLHSMAEYLNRVNILVQRASKKNLDLDQK